MLRKIFDFLKNLPPARALRKFSKRIRPLGFEGLSLYEVAFFFIRGLNRGGLKDRASSMSFNFFIALFPSIIFLFTLIPFIPIFGFQDMLFDIFKNTMPKNASKEILDTINEITHRHHSGLLSVGFIFALYFSTRGVISMMEAFNKSIHVKEKRTFWKHQLVAALLVIILTFALIFAVTIMAGTQFAISEIFHHQKTQHILLLIVQWFVVGFLCLFVIAIFYRYGPSQRMHKNFFSPGVIAATLLIILTSILFAYYVNNFSKYNKLYGSIGSIIVVMIWIYYNSIMLIIGFELDAGIEGGKQNKLSILEQEELTMKKEEEV